MTYDLVVKNGTLVTAEKSYPADVGVRGGRIAAVGPGLAGTREIDATGQLVTPGAIDLHVHLQMPIGTFTSADDFFTGTRAAAFGGTTAIVDFIEAAPEESLLDAMAARRQLADERVVIDYGLHMTITPTDISKLDQVKAAADAGCASFKLYMAYGHRLDDGELMLALEAVRDAGAMPVVHAENWDVICTLVQRNVAAGRTTPHWHPRSRPAPMEAEAAGRVIDIAALVGTPLHIFHISCGDVVERIVAAQARGLPVFGETCPQYLLLDQDLLDRPGVEGALPVCSPPLRPREEQVRLWQGIADGHLDVITTDHCPFTREEKATGLDNFSTIPGGVPSIEGRFSMIHSQGVAGGYISRERWVDVCCTTPARLMGFERKGRLEEGCDADIVVFDPRKKVTLSSDTLHENVTWTPYQGLELTGWPRVTIRRGEVLVEDGEFVAEPGRGRFVHRIPPFA